MRNLSNHPKPFYRREKFWALALCTLSIIGFFHLELNAVGGASPEVAATHFIRPSVEAYAPEIVADDIHWVVAASNAQGHAATQVELIGYIGDRRVASGAFQRFMHFGWQMIHVGLD